MDKNLNDPFFVNLSSLNPQKVLTLTTSKSQSLEKLLEEVERIRGVASDNLESSRKKELGQFLTPIAVANTMAKMFNVVDLPQVRLLEAGAGIGSLSAAFVFNLCRQQKRPEVLEITAYEIDPTLLGYLKNTLELCSQQCLDFGIKFKYTIYQADFIEEAVNLLQQEKITFTHSILNPPYFKINANSRKRQLLSSLGVEVSNIYPGFMFASAQLLLYGGELVAIAPRSFCNGSYFRSFRSKFLDVMALQQIHLFESRKQAFKEDDILQETVIIHGVKQKEKKPNVIINTTLDKNNKHNDHDLIVSNTLPYSEIVKPDDPEHFIWIIPDNKSETVIAQMSKFTTSLKDLNLVVSTGRVVDFRVSQYLRSLPDKESVPLVYPVNLFNGNIAHPKATKKPQALVYNDKTANLLLPNNNYVLTKRFSSKEEKKRIVAAVYEADRFKVEWVGFENHLNYYHSPTQKLDINFARGLATYLNSTLVDSFFRLFNGHTQVNATDLRHLKYPTYEQLLSLGMQTEQSDYSQIQVDEIVEKNLL